MTTEYGPKTYEQWLSQFCDDTLQLEALLDYLRRRGRGPETTATHVMPQSEFHASGCSPELPETVAGFACAQLELLRSSSVGDGGEPYDLPPLITLRTLLHADTEEPDALTWDSIATDISTPSTDEEGRGVKLVASDDAHTGAVLRHYALYTESEAHIEAGLELYVLTRASGFIVLAGFQPYGGADQAFIPMECSVLGEKLTPRIDRWGLCALIVRSSTWLLPPTTAREARARASSLPAIGALCGNQLRQLQPLLQELARDEDLIKFLDFYAGPDAGTKTKLAGMKPLPPEQQWNRVLQRRTLF